LIEASIEKYVLDSFLVFLGVLKAKTLRILGLGSGSSSSVPPFPFRFSEIIGLRLNAAMLYLSLLLTEHFLLQPHFH
jgi:hypothetical protein